MINDYQQSSTTSLKIKDPLIDVFQVKLSDQFLIFYVLIELQENFKNKRKKCGLISV